MFSGKSLQLCSLLGSALALPTSDVANEAQGIAKRNPCDGVNASPALYHSYGASDCPPPISLNADGSCGPQYATWGSPDCNNFCQISTTFTYAQEVPFTNTYCHYGQTCSISQTETATITINLGVNAGGTLAKALNLGITGGVSSSQVKAIARTTTVTPPPGVCGYFTFVPVQKTTCGSFTALGDAVLSLPGGHEELVCGDPHTYGNICASQPWLNTDGSADGETIFVKTNCVTRLPLPSDQQDPVYQQPGVPLSRGQLAIVLLTMQQYNPIPLSAANYSGTPTTTLSFTQADVSVFDITSTGGLDLNGGSTTATITTPITITSPAVTASDTVLSGTITPAPATTAVTAVSCSVWSQCPPCPTGQCQGCFGFPNEGGMHCGCNPCST